MKTNEHIIKEFEKVNAELRKQLRELEAEKQGLEQMLQAQQELLNQRNSVIAELESELSVKEGLLNIKNGLTGKILFPCENKKVVDEILNIRAEDIQDDVHRFGIEYCQECVRGNDRKKEFDEICDMFADYMEDYNKSGVIRFLAELTQKLRESGVMCTVEALDGEISVRDVFIRNQNGVTVDINGIPKEYSHEKISEIVRAYEDIKHCEEHAGEHLRSEEYLKIISLRGENDSLKRKVKELHSKLDESIEAESSLCEEIEKLEADKRESRDKIFPYESVEKMKEKIEALNNRHQSDCIEKAQLHTALDVMAEKYQRLRDIHGL